MTNKHLLVLGLFSILVIVVATLILFYSEYRLYAYSFIIVGSLGYGYSLGKLFYNII